jgi:hypothetical protein
MIPPPITINPLLIDDRPPTLHPLKPQKPYSIRKIAQVQMDMANDFNLCNILKKQLTNQLQGDTGANCGATNDNTLLWDYRRLLKPIPITTYDGNEDSRCFAIGVGTLKIVSNSNTTMPWMMLHTPSSTGTILSPDRYMMDNANVQSFTHHGKKSGTGIISFQNLQGNDIATISMNRRRDGLWFTDNYVLIPTKPAIHTASPEYNICPPIGPTSTPPPPIPSQLHTRVRVNLAATNISASLKQL